MGLKRRLKLFLGMAIPLGLLAVWSLWNTRSNEELSHSQKLGGLHARTPLATIVSSPEPNVTQTLLTPSTDAPARVAKAVCSNATLRMFSDPSRGCENELAQLYESLASRIELYSTGGVKLYPENCAAQSPDGVVSTADDVLSDLYAVGKEMAAKRLKFDFDRDLSAHHLNRMRLVALCHIQKNTQYWLKNPDQMPDPEEIENHLVYDHAKGQPGESKSIGFFLKVLAQVEQMRRAQD